MRFSSFIRRSIPAIDLLSSSVQRFAKSSTASENSPVWTAVFGFGKSAQR